MKINVDRRRLITAIEKKHKKEEQERVALKAAFPALLEKYRKDVVESLKAASDKVKVAKTADAIKRAIDRYDGLHFPGAPTEIKESGVESPHVAAIQRLELSDDTYVTVTEHDDYFKYI